MDAGRVASLLPSQVDRLDLLPTAMAGVQERLDALWEGLASEAHRMAAAMEDGNDYIWLDDDCDYVDLGEMFERSWEEGWARRDLFSAGAHDLLPSLGAVKNALSSCLQKCHDDPALHNTLDEHLEMRWASPDLLLSYRNDLRAWPADFAPVFCNETVELWICSLGSILKLDELVEANVIEKPHLVLSMNAEDEKGPSEPASYRRFFLYRGIKNFRFGGDDRTHLHGGRAFRNMQDFDYIWSQMILRVAEFLGAHSLDGGPLPQFGGGPVRILVHCYGGVNRSGAAVVCLLMYFLKFTAARAVCTLVRARSANRYWRDREYMLEGLLLFDARLRALRWAELKNFSFDFPSLVQLGSLTTDYICLQCLKNWVQESPEMIRSYDEELAYLGSADFEQWLVHGPQEGPMSASGASDDDDHEQQAPAISPGRGLEEIMPVMYRRASASHRWVGGRG